MRFIRSRFFLIAIIAVVTITIAYIMTNQIGMGKEDLKLWISWLNIITISALGITFIAAVMLFTFQNKLSDIQEKDIAEVNRISNEAKLKTAEVEKQNLELMLRIQPRSFSDAQRSKLLSILRKYKIDSAGLTSISNPEAQNLIDQLSAVCRDAGWNTTTLKNNFSYLHAEPDDTTKVGIYVYTTIKELGGDLKSFFSECGMRATIVVTNASTPNITIDVYQKPI